MISISCPCQKCSDRWIDTETLTRCHSTCKKYLNFKKQINNIKAQIQEEKDMTDFSFELSANREAKKQSIRASKRYERNKLFK